MTPGTPSSQDPRQAHATARATSAKIAAAFLCIYIIWGSTYVGIKIAVETLPGFLMAGARFLISGTILIALARLRGAGPPTAREWRASAIAGAFLLLGGNGCVVYAAHRIPSGLSSILVATTALWMVLFEWARPGGTRPGARVLLGLGLGLAALIVLVGRGKMTGSVDPWGAGAAVLGTLFWSTGSIYSPRAGLSKNLHLATGMQMLAGGAFLFTAGLFTGELSGFDPGAVSMRSLAAFLYLTVFGSLVAFTSYVWLLSVVSPASVATYAYVNPIVAVLLGWILMGERPTITMWCAAAVIVFAVAVITSDRTRAAPPSARLSKKTEPAAAPRTVPELESAEEPPAEMPAG